MTQVLAVAETPLEVSVFLELHRECVIQGLSFVTNGSDFVQGGEGELIPAISVAGLSLKLVTGAEVFFPKVNDVEFTSKMQRHFADFVRIYRRNDPLEELSALNMLHLFNVSCNYWRGLLLTSNINIVYFSVVPHQSLEYLLSLVAEELEITCIYFHDLNTLGRKALVRDFRAEWKSIVSVELANICSVEEKEVQRISSQFSRNLGNDNTSPIWLERFNGVSDNRWDQTFLVELKLILRMFFSALISSLNLAFNVGRKLPLNLSGASILQLRRSINNRLMSQRYRDSRTRHQKMCIDVLPQEYYAYFLNYEPEMMVNPLGGEYGDQMMVIAQISGALPPGIPLVVKEHPLQFKSEIGFGHLGRTPYFYDFISAFPNVVLVSEEFSSREIIDKSALVITLNGTVGWEALCRSKPVAVLGGIWYQNSPGTCSLDLINKIDQVSDLISADHSRRLQVFFNECINQSNFFSFSKEAAEAIGVEFCHTHSREVLKLILLNFFNTLPRGN